MSMDPWLADRYAGVAKDDAGWNARPGGRPPRTVTPVQITRRQDADARRLLVDVSRAHRRALAWRRVSGLVVFAGMLCWLVVLAR